MTGVKRGHEKNRIVLAGDRSRQTRGLFSVALVASGLHSLGFAGYLLWACISWVHSAGRWVLILSFLLLDSLCSLPDVKLSGPGLISSPGGDQSSAYRS